MNSNSIVILDAKTIGTDSVFEKFSNFGNVKIFQTTTSDERIQNIGNANIIITNKVIIDKFVLDACPNIELICLTATGMNNVDLPYAAEKEVEVKNVAGYSTESVAQHTFAMLLSQLHNIQYYNNYVQSGEYSNQPLFTHMGAGYWELKGKTWGIIGLGAIGRRVAEIASVFGVNVIYYSTSGKNATKDYKQVELDELLNQSDIVSIHAPLNEQTLNLIGESQLNKMRPNSILINVGRGGIINETDLAKCLSENKIAAACIDVMQKEPLAADSKMLDKGISSKILITPHVAWLSTEALDTLLIGVYNNIENYLTKIS